MSGPYFSLKKVTKTLFERKEGERRGEEEGQSEKNSPSSILQSMDVTHLQESTSGVQAALLGPVSSYYEDIFSHVCTFLKFQVFLKNWLLGDV